MVLLGFTVAVISTCCFQNWRETTSNLPCLQCFWACASWPRWLVSHGFRWGVAPIDWLGPLCLAMVPWCLGPSWKVQEFQARLEIGDCRQRPFWIGRLEKPARVFGVETHQWVTNREVEPTHSCNFIMRRICCCTILLTNPKCYVRPDLLCLKDGFNQLCRQRVFSHRPRMSAPSLKAPLDLSAGLAGRDCWCGHRFVKTDAGTTAVTLLPEVFAMYQKSKFIPKLHASKLDT